MSVPFAIHLKAEELKEYLLACQARCQAIDDESDRVAILTEAMTVLVAEAIHATARAAALEEQLAEVKGDREAIPGLAAMRPLV